MPRKWKQLTNVCVAVLVLLADLKISIGQITTGATGVFTTELTALMTVVATTAARTTSTATADTTVALSELPAYEPNIVENLRLLSSSTTSITVVWDEPLDSVFDSYNISCSSGTADPPIIQAGKTLEASCTGVMPGRLHTITVATVSGSQSNSDDVDIWAKPNTVQDLEGGDVSTTSVSVTWSLPDDHTASYYYMVNCSEGLPVPVNITDGTTTTATCSPVTSDSLVTVTVTTYSGSESNADSTMVRAKPNTVQDLKGGAVTTDGVSVSWTLPDDHTTSYYYIVSCSQGVAVPETITDGTTTATCSPVTAGSIVTVTVTTYSGSESNADSTMVRAKPNTVQDLEGGDVSTTNVSVTWSLPDDHTASYYYMVNCSEGIPVPVNITDGTTTTATCSPVISDSLVTVTVTTYSGSESNADSTMVRAKPNTVQDLEGGAVTTDGVSVTWKQPGDHTASYYYIVDCSEGIPVPVNITDGTTTATCSPVTSGSLVTVTVTTYSGSESKADSTMVRAKPNTVQDLKGGAVTTDGVSVSWTLPDDHTTSYYYIVSCSQGVAVPETITDGTTTATCSPVTAGSIVTVTVTTYSGSESNADSTVVRAKPNTVEDLEGGAVTINNVSVTWSLPDDHTASYFYIVDCSEGTADNENITDGTTTATCSPVTAGSLVRVTVNTYRGSESNADSTIVRAKPNAVEDLEGGAVTTNSVSVTWSLPDDHTASYFYIVDCSQGTADNGNITDGTTTATCSPVTAGSLVTVTVTTYSGSESNADSTIVRAKPNTVEDLEGGAVTTDGVSVSWNLPADHFTSNYYIVSCSQGVAVPENITDGTTTITCSPVTAGSLVMVTVTTYSGSESNADSTMVRAKPNTVEDLEGGAVTTNSVSVTWSLPDDHTASYYYIVDCSQGTADNGNITDGTTAATCSPVTAGSLVTVTVTTYSGSESNADSTMVRAKPNSINALDEGTATIDSVTTSWQKPDGEVMQYNILCSHGNPEQSVVMDDGRPTKYTATCENISPPGTECTITVTPVSDTVAGDSRSINITAYPIPPMLVEAPSTETSISVEWQKPDSEVDYYIIDCPDGTASPPNIIATDGTLAASCTGLTTPGNLYSISVQSQSNEKRSVKTTESINALPASVNLQKSPSLVDIVSATWASPIGVFELFNVQCTPTKDAVPLQDVIPYDPDALSYGADCRVSIPGDLYTMTVVSRSGNQDSSPSTLELRALPEAVYNFTVEAVTTDMVKLEWTMKNRCQNGGCVWSSFNVSHSPDFFHKNVPQNDRSTTFQSLTPGENYTFSIIVLSEKEESSPVTVVERTVPESVDEFSVSLYSTDFVDLYWTIKEICNDNECVWDSYNLTYTPYGDPYEQPGPPLDSTSLSTNVTNLIPGENYNFSITAVSGEKGSSPKSFVQRTIPETVDEFNVTPYLTEMVTLSWTTKSMCENGGCVWDTYNVSYIVSSDIGGTPLEESRNSLSTAIEIDNFTPGESYNFSITVLSGEEKSDFKTVVQRTLPESVKTFKVAQYTDTMADLSWTMKDKCNLDGGCVWSSFKVSFNSSDAKQISRNDRTTRVEPLTPGEYYVFSISVQSEGEVSSAETVSQRLRPSNVGRLDILGRGQEFVTIEWDRPTGKVSGYITTIESLEEGLGGGETGGFDGNLNGQKHTATFMDLTPGLEYAITVCTESSNEICMAPASVSIETLPDEPSAPQDLSLEVEDIHTVIVTFSEPSLPNSDITEYIVRYSGVMDSSGNLEEFAESYTPEGNVPYSVTISDLVAGYTYTFRVTAVNLAGEGDEAADKITLGQLKPVDSTVLPEVVAVSVETDIKSFTLMFSSGWFSHCNGELKTYFVFVVEKGGDETIGVPPRSYKEAQSQKRLPVYLAIANETYPFSPDYSSCAGQRKKRQTPDSVEVVIGSGSCSEDGKYCNGALHGNREYKVKYRACNNVGCSETPYSDIIKTDLHYISWSVPLVIIFSISAIVAFIIWKNRKNPRFTTMLLKRKKSYDDVALENCKSKNRTFTTRPLAISEFSETFYKLMANNCFYMQEDFQGLCALNEERCSKKGMLTGNKKNPKSCHCDSQVEVVGNEDSHKQVWPNDANIPLPMVFPFVYPSEDDIDFVEIGNGQKDVTYDCIQGESSGEFIVCKPPSKNTNYEFWLMLWEQRVHTIIVVGLPQDCKKSSSSYWPSDLDKVEEYQDILVSLTELKKLRPYITLRKLQITRGNLRQQITQVTFTDWPKSGVPDTAETFVEFVKTAKQFMTRSDASTLIHSWNNDGPVGIVLSVYETLQNILSNADAIIDIPLSVGSLKLQRQSLVQTLEEFIFIYKCVLAGLEVNAYEMTVGDDSNPYSNQIYQKI